MSGTLGADRVSEQANADEAEGSLDESSSGASRRRVHLRWLVPLLLCAGFLVPGWLFRPSRRHLPASLPAGFIAVSPTLPATSRADGSIGVELAAVRGVALQSTGKPTAEASNGSLSSFGTDDPAITLELGLSRTGLPGPSGWEVVAGLPAGAYVRAAGAEVTVSRTNISVVPQLPESDLRASLVYYTITVPSTNSRYSIWVSWRHPAGILDVSHGLLELAMPELVPLEPNFPIVTPLRKQTPATSSGPPAPAPKPRPAPPGPPAPPRSDATPRRASKAGPPPAPPPAVWEYSRIVPPPPLANQVNAQATHTAVSAHLKFEFGPIRDYVIDTSSPAPTFARANGDTYWVWNTSDPAPTVGSAHSVSGENTARSEEFYSGIALGVAGAAFVAVIMELLGLSLARHRATSVGNA
jgi:hypothetical protein